jgi:hypothetical protein
MIGALLYLRVTSLRNAAVTRALRLRQPKYLLGALAAVAYFSMFVFRRSYPGAGPGRAGTATAEIVATLMLLGIVVVMIAWVAGAWLFPSSKPALRFSPAEIDFLFPAPISRRTLVHYSLLSSRLTILFSALLLGVLWRGPVFSLGSAAMRAAGWWILISAADFHRSGANLTFARIAEAGGSRVRARILAGGAVVLFLAAVGLSLWCGLRFPTDADLATGDALAHYGFGLLNAGALHWLLLPFRMLAGPLLTAEPHAFLRALGPALLLVALHYVWITRMEVSFAEGSISLAEKRAQALAQPGRGLSGPFVPKARPGPFRLAPRGRPEIAFLWKNMISLSSTLNWRLIMVGVFLVIQALVIGTQLSVKGHRGHVDVALLVVIVASVLGAYVVLAGPQLVRRDLRGDLGNADILKTYPLQGWQVVLGELLTPVAILSAVLWTLLLATASALCFVQGNPEWPSRGQFVVAGLCAACVVPPVCALELLVPNAAMLYFPAWHQAVQQPGRSGGIEMVGQRLIFGAGQVLAIALMLLPAAVAAFLIVFATQWLIGVPAALILATLAVLCIAAGEIWIGLWVLGARFEKLDITSELRP